MITQDEIQKIGQSFLDRIFKTEVRTIDLLGPKPEVEFRLIVLDRAYKLIVPLNATLDKNAATQIWQNIFATYLAEANDGMKEATV